MRRRTRKRLIILALLAGGIVGATLTARPFTRRPRHADVRLGQARIALSQGDYAQAVKFAGEVIADQPGETSAYWILGRAQMGLGRLDLMRQTGEALIKAAPESPDGRRLLVQWSFARMNEAFESEQGQNDVFAEAVVLCREQADWLTDRPATAAEGALVHACCAESLGRYMAAGGASSEQIIQIHAQARRFVVAALAAEPTLWAGWDMVFRLMAPRLEAQATWNAARTLSDLREIPAGTAYRAVAAVFEAAGKKVEPERLALCRRIHFAIRTDEAETPMAELTAAMIALEAGDAEGGVTTAERLIAAGSDGSETQLLLGQSHIRQGRFAPAWEALSTYAQRNPAGAGTRALRELQRMERSDLRSTMLADLDRKLASFAIDEAAAAQLRWVRIAVASEREDWPTVLRMLEDAAWAGSGEPPMALIAGQAAVLAHQGRWNEAHGLYTATGSLADAPGGAMLAVALGLEPSPAAPRTPIEQFIESLAGGDAATAERVAGDVAQHESELRQWLPAATSDPTATADTARRLALALTAKRAGLDALGHRVCTDILDGDSACTPARVILAGADPLPAERKSLR